MRYIWALIAYLAVLSAAITSCGGAGKTNTGAGAQAGTESTGTGNSTGSGLGGGGSSGIGLTTGSGMGGGTTTGTGCSTMTTCAAQNATCGAISDGCGGILMCGSCPSGEACGVSTPNVCGMSCKPATCASLGYDCGPAGDGCGGMLQCGTTCPTNESCGANNKPNVCGMGSCVPETCASQNFNCGAAGDGCGGMLQCGTTCPTGEACGVGMPAKPNVCGSACVPKTCAGQNFNCGAAADGCGGVLQCGTCNAPESCGAAMPNQCGTSATCTGLCLQQMTCPTMGVTTTLTGTVYAPNGTDPLTTALVYIPNAPVQAFTCGVTCGSCSAGVSGSPLVSAVTGIDGKFTLTNVPVGNNIPLVLQLGRWRRQVTINVPACVTTPVPVALTNMPNCRTGNAACPAGKAKGDIPLMAFATGAVDGLECIMHKIGVDETEFTTPSANCGGGRIHLFAGGTPNPNYFPGDPFDPPTLGGATIGGTGSPTESQLWSSQATLNDYDLVLFPCQGAENDTIPAAADAKVVAYANAGGRVFGTHYSYDWFTNVSGSGAQYPWNATATWVPDPTNSNAPSSFSSQITLFGYQVGGEVGYINQTAGTDSNTLAQWLFQPAVGASTTLGRINIYELRHDFDSVVAPSLLWINLKNDQTAGNAPMHYTFNTPVGTPPANQCGRVVYDDFHVEDIEYNNPQVTTSTAFPQECSFTACTTSAQCAANQAYGPGSTCTGGLCMSPQEKLLEFMLFDLASCVPSNNGGCVPKTCAEQMINCGPAGDGCGNEIMCGACGAGETCGGGGTPSVCGTPMCTPKTCAQLMIDCGPAGDGCGGMLTCGTCGAGETCGGGGPGMCGTNMCTPKTCAQQEITCGPAGDGCGGLLACGSCASGQSCGGGGKPGQCGNTCTPRTCAEANATCGSVGDGCGGVLNCGTCQVPLICGYNTPNQCGSPSAM